MDKSGIHSHTGPLLLRLIAEFARGCELIGKLDDLTYRKSANGTGSVGGHFRHNLDFVNKFLNGITEGWINYNNRERDLRVETDRRHAIEKFRSCMSRISALEHADLDGPIYVRSEVNQSSWLTSSAARELEFLHSHTVHHHALIAEKLAGFGVGVTLQDFGVAPSTVEYWKSMAA